MDEFEFERFTSSDSCAKNEKQRKRRTGVGTLTFLLTGTFSLLAFAGVVFVFRSDSKENSFDELVTTGGAVRRSLPGEGSISFPKCKTEQCKKLKKYITDSMNTSVDPCDNFYRYACGGWIEKNPIPKTSSTFSTFSKLNQKVEGILHKILTSHHKEKGMLRSAKDFYDSCMDQKTIDRKGKTPMINLITYLGGWSIGTEGGWSFEEWDIYDVLLKIQTEFTSSGGPLFSVHVSDDPKHSNKHILEV